jgi:hypothetical protein
LFYLVSLKSFVYSNVPNAKVIIDAAWLTITFPKLGLKAKASSKYDPVDSTRIICNSAITDKYTNNRFIFMLPNLTHENARGEKTVNNKPDKD